MINIIKTESWISGLFDDWCLRNEETVQSSAFLNGP